MSRPGRLELGAGFLALALVVATLGDSGITSDEPIDVKVGRRYVVALLQTLDGQFQPFRRHDVQTLFADNAQHPPLGRWLVGLSSVIFEPLEGVLGGADPFSVHAARLAPAAAFSLLVFWLTGVARKTYGYAAGAGTAIGILLMPRVFAHAHFATLDTILTLFWVGSLLALYRVTERIRAQDPVTTRVRDRLEFVRDVTIAGLVWGLALLTKIHAWLLPPLAFAWLIFRLGPKRGTVAFVVWATVGLIVLFAGWPWLWFETWNHLRGFLATSTERLSLRVLYFGTVYPDRGVPWHYPWFYFLATVPIGLHALGLVGVACAWRHRRADPFPWLILGAILLLLTLFSTRAPVYDGERLFLPVFPLWAIQVGRGLGAAWLWARTVGRRLAIVVLILAQGYGVVALHPFGLSYYNALVGGLPGAERLGLELTYWGDTLDRVLLDDLALRSHSGQTAELAPTLHHLQPASLMTPRLYRHLELKAEGCEPSGDWLIVYRRSAYWLPRTRRTITSESPVFVRKRQGVWLSGIWKGSG